MEPWEPFVAAPFALAILAGLVWYYRWYFTTPPRERVGWGKLAPRQQRQWNRFVIGWLVLAAVTWGLTALLT